MCECLMKPCAVSFLHCFQQLFDWLHYSLLLPHRLSGCSNHHKRRKQQKHKKVLHTILFEFEHPSLCNFKIAHDLFLYSAIHSISTIAPKGKAATATVVRAGLCIPNCSS